MNQIADLLFTDDFKDKIQKETLSLIKDTVTELNELDSILNQIKSSSNLSSAELSTLAEQSFTIANQYGKTAKDYLTTVQLLSESGTSNAGQLAELSLALQNAGGISAELANQYLLATNQSYNLGSNTKELTSYFDGINSVAESNSINLGKLAENMSLISSKTANAGIGMDEATAAMATLMSVTDENSTHIADTFTNILSSLNQISDAPMETLEKFAETYNSLQGNDMEKADFLSSIGKDIDTSALEALFENWNLYEQMLSDYQNGIGSLSSTASEAVDTWEGNLNRLSNTWTDTVGNIADSEMITTGINALADLLSIANKITETIGPLASISLIGGGILSSKNLGK